MNIGGLFLCIVVLTITACNGRVKKEIAEKIPLDSIQEISARWKEDSLGCERLRDPQKIRRLISQLELEGKDSLVLLEYLGKPNGRNFLKDSSVVFYYYMDCSVQHRSSYNFYCIFENSKLSSTQTAVLD